MSFIKKIKNKVLKDYNNRRSYLALKIFLIVLLVLIIYPFVLDLIESFIWIFSNEPIWKFWFNLSVVLFIFFAWMLIYGIMESFFLSSLKIEENMDELPKYVWFKKTLVQYGLSKKISPSEAGMILYRKAEISNLICILYKWLNERKIDLYMKDGNRYITSLENLWIDAPDYEIYLFDAIFGWQWKSIKFNKMLLWRHKVKVNNMIFKTCVDKWFFEKEKILDKGNQSFVKKSPVVATSFSIWCSLSILILLWMAVTIVWNRTWSMILLIFIVLLLWNLFWNKIYKDKLTDKGKEMLSEVVWYKYYLENCEEEEINANLWKDESYSKHLPYAIALKLNWKIIDELS